MGHGVVYIDRVADHLDFATFQSPLIGPLPMMYIRCFRNINPEDFGNLFVANCVGLQLA
jgi:hypothetical protein